jgi:hypothetical protein
VRLVSTELILPDFLVSPSARGQEEKVEFCAGEKKDVSAVKGVCKTEMREPIKEESIPRGIMWDHVCEYPLRFIVFQLSSNGHKTWGKVGSTNLNLPRFASPTAGTSLPVRLSGGGLCIHAVQVVHCCGLPGPKPKCPGGSSRDRRPSRPIASI